MISTPKIEKIVAQLETYMLKLEDAFNRRDGVDAEKYLGLVSLYRYKLGAAIHDEMRGTK